MKKRTVRDMDLSGKRVLVRVDFNVPLDPEGRIADDRRIRAALPTLEHCLEYGASIVLMTHLGRPGNTPEPRLSTAPLAARLGELLKTDITHTQDILGEDATSKARSQQAGTILMLENLRFDPGEKSNDADFAQRLRDLGDLYINDAFSVCHRRHASVFKLPGLFPDDARGIGMLIEAELEALDALLESPRRPLLAILGGAKVGDKIGVIEALLDRVDRLLVGGAMAYTFLKAHGANVGDSMVEDDQLELAARLLGTGDNKLVLPKDHVVTRNGETHVIAGEIPSGWSGMDIGPDTIERYVDAIGEAATVAWNGPMGKFEDDAFREGTDAIVRALAHSPALTVVGGGETAEAVERLKLSDRFDHISTGGGAFLEYLRGQDLPALSAI